MHPAHPANTTDAARGNNDAGATAVTVYKLRKAPTNSVHARLAARHAQDAGDLTE